MELTDVGQLMKYTTFLYNDYFVEAWKLNDIGLQDLPYCPMGISDHRLSRLACYRDYPFGWGLAWRPTWFGSLA